MGTYDGYYVVYELITLSCILFMFIEMEFIPYHLCDVCNKVHDISNGISNPVKYISSHHPL